MSNSELENHNHRKSLDEDQLNNWQSLKCNLRERNKFLIGNELMSDVVFIVGKDRVPVPAHRYVLAITSFTFFNYLYMMRSDSVDLPPIDVELPAFMTFLHYIYSDELRLNGDTVYEVLKLAIQFEIPHLEKLCIDYIEGNLNVENVLDVLEQSCQLNSIGLRDKCYKIIEWTIKEIFKTQKFLHASRDVLKIILELPRINCKEIELFQAVMEWARLECHRNNRPDTPENKRFILGNFIYLIRFPTMSTEEFSECAKMDGFLTSEEISKIFLSIMNKFTEYHGDDLTFPTTPRTSRNSDGIPYQGVKIFNRFVRWAKPLSPSSDAVTHLKHSLLIHVNRPILVTGFGIIMDNRISRKVMEDMFLNFNNQTFPFTAFNEKMIFRKPLDPDYSMIRMLFENPVLLEAHEIYLVQLYNANGLRNVCGEVRDKISHGNLMLSFKKPTQCPYVNTIAEILFQE